MTKQLITDLYVLQPMAFDGVGPSQTCMNICKELSLLGVRVHLYGTRRRLPKPNWCNMHTPFWNIGSVLPYKFVAKFLTASSERKMLADIPNGSIVHVWPSLRSDIAAELKRRGCFIAVDIINIVTIYEKEIIEGEMGRENFYYDHYVTNEKIENQKELLGLGDLFFASNQFSEDALVKYGVDKRRVVSTCYAAKAYERRVNYETQKPIFTFVGRINLEKGVHLLLRAWQLANVDGELHLYGNPDQIFLKRYKELLDSPTVQVKGFSRNMRETYNDSDCFIFLSLAEGGALVSMEAAALGLPMILSPMGAGRLALQEHSAIVVDPHDTSAVADAIRKVAESADLRMRLGEAAFEISEHYSWKISAFERKEAIEKVIGEPKQLFSLPSYNEDHSLKA